MGLLDAPPIDRLARGGLRGNRVVFFGDSLTFGYLSASGENYPQYATLLSGGRVIFANNAGISGNTTTQMLARIDTDVLAYTPSVVVLMAGRNDISGSVALATWQGLMRSIATRVQSSGALLVLATMPPTNENATRTKNTIIYNNWIRRLAAAKGYPLIDFYALLTDPATGFYLSAYNNDGIHPSSAGYRAMGQLAASVLTSLLQPYTPPLANDNVDANNLIVNGCMLTDANTDGKADSWAFAGTASSGVTYSLVTDANYKGKAQRIALANPNGTVTMSQTISNTLYTAGHTLGIGFKLGITSPTIAANKGVTVTAVFSGISTTTMLKAVPVAVPGGSVYYCEVTPSLSGSSLVLTVTTDLGATDSATVDVGQFTVYNLTTQAILTT